MTQDPAVRIGRTSLKNPVIAAAGEHLIDAEGVRAALRSGAAAVVIKSTNESAAAKAQLEQADYVLLDDHWRPLPWSADVPRHATLACRSGLSPHGFDEWLETTASLDREARADDAYVVASLILGEVEPAVAMARRIEDAGIRVLEFNLGTPYASQAAAGAVSTELSPARIGTAVRALRSAVGLPIWVKISGQSERVPELAEAAFEAGADSVVMAGRLLGFVPDVETMAPLLDTSLGVGGYWNLPLTCHWLATTRRRLGTDRPLIATNGVMDGLDVARVLLAGASAAEICTAVMVGGYGILSDAVAAFSAYLERQGCDADALIGKAADRRRRYPDMPRRPEHWRAFVPGSG
jgi:dihydroorotate dehydrogenase (NAD+) catalytic subunit